jgi:hypothetical protein
MRYLFTICTALFALGCGSSLRTIDGGKPGYIALEKGGKDRAILYCTDPASGVVTCKEVWREK